MSLLSSKRKTEQSSRSATTNNEELGEEKNKLWINAWYDPLAGVCVQSSCMDFTDINGDGDYKLIAASSSNNPLSRSNNTISNHKLKVYKGTSVITENVLLEEPIGIVSYFSDYKTPRRPLIAVASGSHIFLYRNMQPYHKFTVPTVEINESENAIWDNLKMGKYDAKTGFEELLRLRESGVQLTHRSYEVLSINDPDEIVRFINLRKDTPLVQQTVITAITVLAKDREESDAVSCLVIATESKKVLILDPLGANVLDIISVPSQVAFMTAAGALDVDSRIIVACRDGNIYTIKNRKVSGVVIELDTQACCILKLDKNILIGTVNNALHCFSPRGKKQYSIYLPCSIKNMELLDMTASRNVKSVIVALENKELRIYNGKNLVHSTETYDEVTGLKFGTYGSEANTLAISYRNGGLELKVVSRKAKLESSGKGGPPPEQEVPLNLPVRTKLYMDQTEREKKYSTEMHRIFQKELCKLRLTTARAFVKILTDGQGPLSYTSGASIRLTASVQGLGPSFKIKLNVQNTGVKPMMNIPIIFSYNQDIYQMKQTRISVPVLLPGLQYEYHGDISLLPNLLTDETTGEQQFADLVKVFVCSTTSSIPLITAVVQMPIPELGLIVAQ